MSIDFKCPTITMQLYETELYELQKFISTKKVEGGFTKDYLILYNFADDCRYAKNIQPELIRYLLPFYIKTIEQAVIYENKMAIDIYIKFNSMIFYNKRSFENAVGEKKWQHIMEYYIEQTIKKMEIKSTSMFDWISLYNTTIALHDDNILKLFKIIFESSPRIKYVFFKYLSVLLFKESDNLLAANVKSAFWTSDIWDFDIELTGETLWSDSIIKYFDEEITKERVESLFKAAKPVILEKLDTESVNLLEEEMRRSFITANFYKRKCEYLKKINCKDKRDRYWADCF